MSSRKPDTFLRVSAWSSGTPRTRHECWYRPDIWYQRGVSPGLSSWPYIARCFTWNVQAAPRCPQAPAHHTIAMVTPRLRLSSTDIQLRPLTSIADTPRPLTTHSPRSPAESDDRSPWRAVRCVSAHSRYTLAGWQ